MSALNVILWLPLLDSILTAIKQAGILILLLMDEMKP